MAVSSHESNTHLFSKEGWNVFLKEISNEVGSATHLNINSSGSNEPQDHDFHVYDQTDNHKSTAPIAKKQVRIKKVD